MITSKDTKLKSIISEANNKIKATMKFIAALSLFQLASAFTSPAANKPATALYSSYLGPEGGDLSAPPLGGSSVSTRTTDIWETSSSVKVQGASLRTWAIKNSDVERVQVAMKTEGRPLNTNIELWHGPDYTPMTMKVYTEDGNLRPLNAVIETPKSQNAVAIYNTGQPEFPLDAVVEGDANDGTNDLAAVTRNLEEMSDPNLVQGGALRTYPFSSDVQSVQVLLKSDGRNLKARVELLQGPNNIKQVVEFYSSDGLKRPLFVVLDSPGIGNGVRVINEATVEFPFTACVEPYLIEAGSKDDFFVIDG